MAIQQGTVTITGFVGSMPVPFGRSGGVEGCSFRMGSTRRYSFTRRERARGRTRLVQGRKQHRRQNGNNRNNDKKFNQRKIPSAFHMSLLLL